MKKRLLPALLALVMALTMLPLAAFADDEPPADNVYVISKGGLVTTEGTITTVTFGKGAMLYYAPANGAGRSEGYHAGIKMIVPAPLPGSAKYRKTSQWWNDTDGTAPAEDDTNVGWTNWNAITLDGDNYMECWGVVNPNYFGQYGNKETGTLYNHYQFDWNGDGRADQDVCLLITKEATLIYGDKKVWPVTVDIPDDGTVSEDKANEAIGYARDTVDKTATFDATSGSGNNPVTIPAESIQNAAEAEINVAVKTKLEGEKTATVTLNHEALFSVVGVVGTEDSPSEHVSISIKDVSSDETVTDKPANAKASYRVEVKLGETIITGENSWKDKSGITLTVPKPDGVADANALAVCLDDTKAKGVIVSNAEEGYVKFTVPHLTVVSLVERAAVEDGETVTVYTEEQLTTALSDSAKTTITLGADIKVTDTITVERAVTIYFDGHKVSGSPSGSGSYIFKVGKADGQEYTDMIVSFKNAQIENTGTSNNRCLEVKPGVTMYISGDRTEVTGSGNVIVNAGILYIYGGKYTCTDTDESYNVILTGSGTYKDASTSPVTIIMGATLTNENGIGASAVWGATINVDGTTITAKGNALGGNNTAGPQNLNVYGGTLISTADAAIYQAATGALTISGGEITGVAGVAVRAGTVTVTGGTITATGTGKFKVGDKTDKIPVAGIVYDVVEGYSGYDTGKITVSGDAVVNSTGTDTPAVTVYGGNDNDANKLEVKGGTFSTSVEPKYLADGLIYEATTSDGKHSYHDTKAEAETTAGAGGTVKYKAAGENGAEEWKDLKDMAKTKVTFTESGNVTNGYITVSGESQHGKIIAHHYYLVQVKNGASTTITIMQAVTGDKLEFMGNRSSVVSVWGISGDTTDLTAINITQIQNRHIVYNEKAVPADAGQ